MSDDPTNDRLSSRLADLRSLGDRQREFHPVSMLRKELSAPASAEAEPQEPPAAGPEPQSHAAPTLDERARTLARRVFSSLLNLAEQRAQRILLERKSAVSDLQKQHESLRHNYQSGLSSTKTPADFVGPDAD